MIAGYRRVLESLYDPENYFQRCRRNLKHWKPVPGSLRRLSFRDLLNGWRAFKGQAFQEPYRKSYRRFLRWVALHHPAKLSRALAQAAAGHHYITYTRDVVVPSLIESASKLVATELPTLQVTSAAR